MMDKTGKYSILVVDDENSNILTLTHVLSPDYTIYAAKNGESAIKAAEKHLPDVILLDIIMPEMDGYEVIAALKNSEKTKDIPVIFITGLSSVGDEEKGFALGISDYIAKPFSPAIVKLRVLNQIKLLEQFRTNEYDIMKYKLSNDALKIGLWDMDIMIAYPIGPDSKFTWSQEFRTMLGFTDENDFPDILNSWSSRLHPEDKERTLKAFIDHVDDVAGLTPYDIEYRLMLKNGDYRHFRALGTTLRDNDGNPLRVAGALMDITEKKQMEEKAREDEERMQLMIDNMPLACTLINRDHKFIIMNRASMALFEIPHTENISAEEITKIYIDRLPEFQPCGRNSLELTYEYIEKAFKEGYQQFEWMYKKPNGERVPCEDILIRVRYKGEYVLAGYARDLREQEAIIEEMRKAEAAEIANRAKSDFLAKMSHEIRTPMNAILGITEIQLQNEELEKNTKDAFEKIHSSGDLLLGIINNILDLSKIDAGKLELIITDYEIASLINDAIHINMIRIGSKPIEFDIYIDENIPSILLGDGLRIKQILNNILSNAFKYTEKGTVKLSVSHEVNAENKNEIIIIFCISDTGQGMTEEQINKLFDLYSQFNQESNRTIEGTGLGMSIVQNLIQLMNGKIFIESKPGKGSTFTVHLPQWVMADADILGKEAAESLREFRTSSNTYMKKTQITREPMPYGKVLIVDDVEMNIFVAKGLLAPYKLTTNSADSGFSAIEKIKAGNVYDIVFMDHMMPKMNGMEATKIIREMGYTHPIVALTANVVARQLEMFLANGFDDFISKPIDIRQLNNVLNKFIRDKQAPEVIEAARQQTEKNGHTAGKKQIKETIDPRMAEIFVRDASKAIAVLDAMFEKQDIYEDDDIQEYTVVVHGMKSVLLNIGKSELSDFAFKLEQAGKEGNIEIIKSETPKFLKLLRKLVEKFTPKLNEEDVQITDEDQAQLHEKLLEVKAACELYDKKTAKNIITELRKQKWSQATAKLLITIDEQLLHSDFDEIVENIDKFYKST